MRADEDTSRKNSLNRLISLRASKASQIASHTVEASTFEQARSCVAQLTSVNIFQYSADQPVELEIFRNINPQIS